MKKVDLAFLSKKEMKSTLEKMKKDDVFFNPDGIEIGEIAEINVLDRKTREGNAFQQVELVVRAEDGKTYKKRYSVDFYRKFGNQIGYKAIETIGATVVFKPQPKYKNIGWFAYVTQIPHTQDENGNVSYEYDIYQYIDDENDSKEKLEKLGI